jgi:GNAT superfamily N-acetyltransferase
MTGVDVTQFGESGEPAASRMIVSTVERPDLVHQVALWQYDAFGRAAGRGFEDTLADVRESLDATGMPRVFVLLADGVPVGTASLTADDLEERPDLSPWLASVVVAPEARRRGHAAHLVAAVEAAARARSVATLWLYTSTAERIYARLGWVTVEMVSHGNRLVALMRRSL